MSLNLQSNTDKPILLVFYKLGNEPKNQNNQIFN